MPAGVRRCAFKAAKGQRSIHYMGRIKMMGATQPFGISGAINETVNVPKEATVDDFQQAYIQSWKIGAKAISIYRQQAHAAAEHVQVARRRCNHADGRGALVTQPVRRKAAGRTPRHHAQSSASRGTRVTSRWVCSKTDSPARSSS
ncbi:MAG: hypothetical protein U0Q11_21035 [Vicinamibacterales bacterium]